VASEHVKFKTPGHLIKQAREDHGITLKELADNTRIPVKLLDAIENDNYDQLSGSVYVRSFLKTCAHQLDLEPSVLLEHFERMVAEDSTPEIPPEQTWEAESQVEHISSFPALKWHAYYGYTAGAVVVIILAIIFWPRGSDKVTEVPIQQEVVVEEQPVEQPAIITPDPESDVVVEDQVETQQAQGNESDPEPDPEPEPEVVTEETVQSDLLEMLPVPDSTLEFSDGKTWPLVLRLVFDAESDVEVGIDTGSSSLGLNWDHRVRGLPAEGVKSGTLYSFGGKYVFYFGAKDHFLLKLRDHVEVLVTLNGQDIEIPRRVIGRQWVLDSDTVSR